jgi:hypothetical protein
MVASDAVWFGWRGANTTNTASGTRLLSLPQLQLSKYYRYSANRFATAIGKIGKVSRCLMKNTA